MAMIAAGELNRAVNEDAEMSRAFALRTNGAHEFPGTHAREEGAYAAPGFSLVDAVAMPGVRKFPGAGYSPF